MPKRIVPLTDPKIKNAKPGEKPRRLFDGGGLHLLINPDGSKYWRLKYLIHGKEKRISLGVYPDVTLAEARSKAAEERRKLKDGADPAVERKTEKESRRKEAANTFKAVALEWFAKAYAEKARTTCEKTMTFLEKDVFPWIGGMPIADIKASDVRAVIERIEQRGALDIARRVFNYVGRVLRYADSKELVKRDVSASIDLALILPKRDTTHHAAITNPQAVGGLMRAIDGFTGGFSTVRALKLSALTFVRPGELRHAEWQEIDLAAAVWLIPGAKMKMGLDHIVPLSSQAVAILREMYTVTGHGRYVFPSERGGARCMSENTLNAALRRMGFTKNEMTAHGFRALARTILDEELKFRPDYIEHQLAHAVRDPNGRAYNRATHLPERREMMQRWADYLAEIAKDGKIVPFKKKAS